MSGALSQIFIPSRRKKRACGLHRGGCRKQWIGSASKACPLTTISHTCASSGISTLARILLAQCDDRSVEKVHELLNRLLDAAEQGGRTGRVIEILVLQALVQRL